MAIPIIAAENRTASSLLFERLPDRLFAPLASANRWQYWAILCKLYDERFGPDAPLPPSHGFAVRAITLDIEDELQTQDAWVPEGATLDTPLNIRAIGVFKYLLASGWFRLEQHGIEKRVTMRPAVGQFLSQLVAFAEKGPIFVSAKIHSIDLLIQDVLNGNGGGDLLYDAAEQARSLLNHVRNTGSNIRDIMDAVSEETSTAAYVQRFFSDYIQHIFIGDYRELRTREHPLSRRPQILRAIEDISLSDEHRTRLIAWYEAKRSPGNRHKAEELFERDLYRISELRRIDEYLDRLDEEVRRANRKALTRLDYQLRSLRPVEHLVKVAIAATLSGNRRLLADPFAPGVMVAGDCLAEPRRVIERAPPSPLRKQVPSDYEIAKTRLVRRAREVRSMTMHKINELVRARLGDEERIDSATILGASIPEIRAYQELARMTLVIHGGSQTDRVTTNRTTKGYRVRQSNEAEPEGSAITGKAFTIERR